MERHFRAGKKLDETSDTWESAVIKCVAIFPPFPLSCLFFFLKIPVFCDAIVKLKMKWFYVGLDFTLEIVKEEAKSIKLAHLFYYFLDYSNL